MKRFIQWIKLLLADLKGCDHPRSHREYDWEKSNMMKEDNYYCRCRRCGKNYFVTQKVEKVEQD